MMTTNTLCPYCSERRTDSRDNVFPGFLGGSARIPSCTRCNNTFGHTFEAAALRNLKPLMFELRRSGMLMPTKITWKNVDFGDGTGRYHVDQDLNAVPAVPKIERDGSGKIVRATGSRRHVTQIKKSVEQSGSARMRIVAHPPRTGGPRLSHSTLAFDDHIKRLCIKMSVGASSRIGVPLGLGVRAREFLLSGTTGDICPVRIVVDHYSDLDQRRPRAGHLVYVHANESECRAYSVVQFFGAIQFYCELNDEYSGGSASALATHDPVTHAELFESIDRLNYPLPPRYVSGALGDHMAGRLERLRLELVELYGDQAPESLSTTFPSPPSVVR